MNISKHSIPAVYLLIATVAVSCSDLDGLDPEPAKPNIVYPCISTGVLDMACHNATRAISPMGPEVEKYVKTLAVFEFDNEDIHTKDKNTYHFIDFTKGTVDDISGIIPAITEGVVEESLNYQSFYEYNSGKICLVANVEESIIQKQLYENPDYHEPDQSENRLSYNMFKKWTLPLDIIRPGSTVYDETRAGTLENMYMFGYYQGPITSKDTVTISLGRLATRLDITVINDTGEEITKRLGYHFDRVCTNVRFFPMREEADEDTVPSIVRTIICAGLTDTGGYDELSGTVVTRPDATFKASARHTRYFYVGAHSAKGIEDATKLHLFYNRRILVGEETDATDMSNSVQIPLCNVHPDAAAGVVNGYSLSRNTRYNFVIRLKKKKTETPASESGSAATPTRSAGSEASDTDLDAEPDVIPGSKPGEYIVYLP